MIDKSIPYYPLTMYKTDTECYPRYDLPQGYEFVFYQKGDEAAWAKIECAVDQFSSVEKGIECFMREFVDGQNLDPENRMLFVKDEKGEYVATASLWNGDYLGEECQRIHWVAVKDECAGKGIAKALLTRLMDLYHELGYGGFIYLLTGTRNYPAVGIYRRFGFVEYMGPRSLSDELTDEQFVRQTETAVALVNERLALGRDRR